MSIEFTLCRVILLFFLIWHHFYDPTSSNKKERSSISLLWDHSFEVSKKSAALKNFLPKKKKFLRVVSFLFYSLRKVKATFKDLQPGISWFFPLLCYGLLRSSCGTKEAQHYILFIPLFFSFHFTFWISCLRTHTLLMRNSLIFLK